MPSKAPGRFYDFLRVVFGAILAMTMRRRTAGLENLPAQGGFILAVCHLHHLDPFVVSTFLKRRIGWMSRIEFCKNRLLWCFLHHAGAFPVNRTGYVRPALREALLRLERGEAIGIFPEGEIMSGPQSVLHGGPLRQGTAWLAAHSGLPVVPLVILGTDQLSKISPWLPALRGRLWLQAGRPLLPPTTTARPDRAAFNNLLEKEFQRLAQEILARHNLPPSTIP